MAFTIAINPNVKYNGKVLPADKKPYVPTPIDANVNYAGSNLPAAAKKFVPIGIDSTNQPNLVILSATQSAIVPFNGVTYKPPVQGDILPNGAIVLPADVMIHGNMEKIIADTTIIDGVDVSEHIRRTPMYIEMEFVIRERNGNQWFFGQDYLDALYQKIILPQTVIFIGNTMLNKLGIQEVIILKMEMETLRGSINIPFTLKMKENIPGQSLIVSP